MEQVTTLPASAVSSEELRVILAVSRARSSANISTALRDSLWTARGRLGPLGVHRPGPVGRGAMAASDAVSAPPTWAWIVELRLARRLLANSVV